MPNPRIRDLGYIPGQTWLKPGPVNTIEDVPGVQVGLCTLRLGEYDATNKNASIIRTGVTIISPRPEPEAWAEPVYAVVWALNGGGEVTGAHVVNETGLMFSPMALCGTTHVGATHEGLLKYLVNHVPDTDGRGRSIPKTNLMPVVGETWDSGLSDGNAFAVKPEHVYEAFKDLRRSQGKARPHYEIEGSLGGGTGMQCQGFKGGNGSSSRLLPSDQGTHFTLGCFVQANFGTARDLKIGSVPVGAILCENGFHGDRKQQAEVALNSVDPPKSGSEGSVLIILATDAPLLPHHLKRLCKRASLGLARTGAAVHSSSGDIVIAFSTTDTLPKTSSTASPDHAKVGPVPLPTVTTLQTQTISESSLNLFIYAAADVVEEAVLNALCAGKDEVGFQGASVKGLPHAQIKQMLERHLPKSGRAAMAGAELSSPLPLESP